MQRGRVEAAINERKLRLIDHIMRKGNLEVTSFLGGNEGKRSRGRPRIRCMDRIIMVLNVISTGHILARARDHSGWAVMVH